MSTALPSRTRLFAALAAVYVLWGSTYLAIRFAVATIPPFTMAGARFVGAGLVLYAWTRLRGEPKPRAIDVRHAVVGGALMMLFSNGLVSWAQTRVDSGLAALLVACVPLWMLLADWWFAGGARPRPLAAAGVVLGIGGVGLLVQPGGSHGAIDPLGAAALIAATLAWTAGSLFARRVKPGPSPLVAAALQMTCGGVLQALAGALLGEWNGFDVGSVTFVSFASWFYLLVAGSLVGFTAYLWLLRHTTPALASSYAFVNPIVAIALGAALGGEHFDGRDLAAAAAIVLAVVLVVLGREPRD